MGKGAAKDGGTEHSVPASPDLVHRGPSLPQTDQIRIQKRKSHFFFLILLFFFMICSRKARSNVIYESQEVHINNSSRRGGTARAWGLPHFVLS